MFTKDIADTVAYVEKRAQDFAKGCKNVYVAVSGGVDSAVVVTLLSRVFGAKRVVELYRDVRSNPEHHADVIALQKAVGFRLFSIDANKMYDDFLAQCRTQFIAEGMLWCEEGSEAAEQNNWDSGYASLKSRLNTPMAGFVAKVIDNGGGRVFGTGNMEEDYLLRYFDKGGDGVVDNNLLMGLLKMEVRQIALFFAREYNAEIFAKIAHKIPSADLHANGDVHNDESELTALARKKGYDITLSYGTAQEEATSRGLPSKIATMA